MRREEPTCAKLRDSRLCVARGRDLAQPGSGLDEVRQHREVGGVGLEELDAVVRAVDGCEHTLRGRRDSSFAAVGMVAGRLREVADQLRTTRAALRDAHGWIMDTYLLRRIAESARKEFPATTGA